jgi:hypothetical protein
MDLVGTYFKKNLLDLDDEVLGLGYPGESSEERAKSREALHAYLKAKQTVIQRVGADVKFPCLRVRKRRSTDSSE